LVLKGFQSDSLVFLHTSRKVCNTQFKNTFQYLQGFWRVLQKSAENRKQNRTPQKLANLSHRKIFPKQSVFA
ncbi:MAG: hypothetical protein ACK5Z2_18190, partial [Bacteroidota bacterium]